MRLRISRRIALKAINGQGRGLLVLCEGSGPVDEVFVGVGAADSGARASGFWGKVLFRDGKLQVYVFVDFHCLVPKLFFCLCWRLEFTLGYHFASLVLWDKYHFFRAKAQGACKVIRVSSEWLMFILSTSMR